ncbi:hypothetical protein J2I47_18035 [Fibrella sp. HMF5335]|uniref:PIN domain-containing protein n=1 Tax=Fibrella rubiginis TaxID=2817060 RepID=A0A939GFZ9_9BACT|nr:PIN domain-containing protein [Fibrella rubiginis]MBO0938457.1 hypothetical protein [Fibrella rubiginis]
MPRLFCFVWTKYQNGVIATERVAVIADADDNRFLEAAKAGSADYIITGNTNDFLISSFGETSIVTPKVYWEQHRPL